MNEQLLRKLPKVDELLRAPELEALRPEIPEQTITEGIRNVIAQIAAKRQLFLVTKYTIDFF